MKKINLLLIILSLVFLLTGLGLYYLNKSEIQQVKETPAANQNSVKSEHKIKINTKQTAEKSKEAKKTNLYSSYLDKVTMNSISEISKTGESVQAEFNKLLENSEGIYFVKRNSENNETVILSEDFNNSADKYSRHNLTLTTITADNKIKHKRLGYEGLEGETENAVMQKSDIWVYDENIEPPRPLSHTVYGKGKKIVFTETWNYSEDNPIKYEMKNADGKTLSVLKETIDNGINYRKEHIFYDKDGNTEMSISASYEGADLKRLNYYDSKSPKDSFIIENAYNDGLKTEEKLYNSDLQVIEIIKADYENSELKELQINDSEGNEIEILEQQNQ